MKAFSEYYAELKQYHNIGDVSVVFKNDDSWEARRKNYKDVSDAENLKIEIKRNQEYLKSAEWQVKEYKQRIADAEKNTKVLLLQEKHFLKKVQKYKKLLDQN